MGVLGFVFCASCKLEASTESHLTDHLQQAFYIAAACVLAKMTSGSGLFVNTWNLTFREWASFGYVSSPTIVTFQLVADSGQEIRGHLHSMVFFILIIQGGDHT